MSEDDNELLAFTVLDRIIKDHPGGLNNLQYTQEIIRRLKAGGMSEITIRNTLLEPKKELHEHLRKV